MRATMMRFGSTQSDDRGETGCQKIACGTTVNDKPTEKMLGQIGREELLPKKYWDRRQAELTATVEAGENQINFSLAE